MQFFVRDWKMVGPLLLLLMKQSYSLLWVRRIFSSDDRSYWIGGLGYGESIPGKTVKYIHKHLCFSEPSQDTAFTNNFLEI